MSQVKYSVEGDKLLIEIDISEEEKAKAPPSSTGKTRMVATTGGYIPFSDKGVKLSVNVTTKK